MSHLSCFASKAHALQKDTGYSVTKFIGNYITGEMIMRFIDSVYDFNYYRLMLLVTNKMKIPLVFNIASLFSTSLCCYNGCKIILKIQSNYIFSFVSDIWDYPYSTTVSLGEQATLFCYSDGSYFYWFIDGVNSENMTTEELETRGISFSGYYNHNPPY